MVSAAHAAGAKVYAFGVKDAETGKRLEQIGVDDVGTPFPALFL
jgi:glycerophosphoryl diester phosphodiesterase